MRAFFGSVTKNRDTDADWKEIGRIQPYWGVLTHPEFYRENMSSENLAAFYETGVLHIASVAHQFARLFGAPLHVASALDFGCGTGRMTEAMTTYSDQVFGYDISAGMLQEAKANSKGRAIYTDQLPVTRVDWINSYIVFQHIPPERGFALLENLLALLADDGLISLYFTIYRDAVLASSRPRTAAWRRLARIILEKTKIPDPRVQPVGTMQMYAYDLTRIVRMLHRSGIERLTMLHEDHGGYHGVAIFGRREGRGAE